MQKQESEAISPGVHACRAGQNELNCHDCGPRCSMRWLMPEPFLRAISACYVLVILGHDSPLISRVCTQCHPSSHFLAPSSLELFLSLTRVMQ